MPDYQVYPNRNQSPRRPSLDAIAPDPLAARIDALIADTQRRQAAESQPAASMSAPSAPQTVQSGVSLRAPQQQTPGDVDAVSNFLSPHADDQSFTPTGASGPEYPKPAERRVNYDFGDGHTGSYADTSLMPWEQKQADAADARDADKLKQADTLNAFFNPQAEQMRGEQQQQAVEKAVAPVNAAGHNALELQHEKNAGDIELQKVRNEGLVDTAHVKTAGSVMDPSQVEWLAQQATRDFNGTMSKVPSAMRPQILQRLAQLDVNPNSPTNQSKQMSETSNDILDVLDRNDYTGQAQQLHAKGLFTPGVGSIRRFAAEHGAGTLLGVDDNTASQMGQFETTHGLLISAIQRAHAGARGAGNSDMAARFEKLLADQGDIPTFLGELKGMRGLLEQYASHTNPTRGFTTGMSESDDLGPAWGK